MNAFHAVESIKQETEEVITCALNWEKYPSTSDTYGHLCIWAAVWEEIQLQNVTRDLSDEAINEILTTSASEVLYNFSIGAGSRPGVF